MKIFLIIPVIFLFFNQLKAQNQGVKIALAKYNGGGDWYANPTSLPNLIKYCNENLKTNINPEPSTVEIGSAEIFSYPFVHMTGHGNIILSESESQNLRMYFESGGFLHVDDNYGIDEFFRREIKKIFPDKDLTELPVSHPIFHQKYEFDQGLPKIHEHDNKQPQTFGIFIKKRIIYLYTFEYDLNNG